ncbi:ribbon-helix-helix domain-containing protein [Anoxybacillus flavithermus]|uniref:Predicted DNA-binding protein ribbon-helix-helix domain-containing protein n=1 Tax=Anoxybacillus flavithermus TaxID=33934 RepID=A0A178TMZ5_9BACL|nr:ribbon-helix-helix domain-containing protein [Anoxybacillus flavithermus]OAO82577.1 hypothetical protein TAF16_0197 [Anoxybacillus flavithermus]
MASKELKTRTQFGSTLKNELYNELKKISDKTSIPISKLLDKAIELLIEDFKKKGMY